MHVLRPRYVFQFLVLLLAAPLAAQQGTLDATFDGDGKTVIYIDAGGDLADYAHDVATQFDGKLVIAGSASVSQTDRDVVVARLNFDGSLDTSFGSGGKALMAFDLGNGHRDYGTGVALQGDGKIVVAGRGPASTIRSRGQTTPTSSSPASMRRANSMPVSAVAAR